MPNIFSKIVKGEIPCHKIVEDNNYLAFLDIRPLNPGHTLVIPKKEIDDIFDLEDHSLGGLMIFAKRVAKMIKKSLPCKKVGVIVAGLDVPHAHMHLVPIFEISDLNFAKAKPASDHELARIAETIRKYAS